MIYSAFSSAINSVDFSLLFYIRLRFIAYLTFFFLEFWFSTCGMNTFGHFSLSVRKTGYDHLTLQYRGDSELFHLRTLSGLLQYCFLH